MDTIDRILVVILAIALAAISYVLSTSYTDKKVCGCIGGTLVSGKCLDVREMARMGDL